VLLGPLVVVVAGVGSGVRVFDGRLRQPGLGAKRPRGFTDKEPVPAAARVAAPHAISAAVVAHAYDRSGSFADVVRRGVREARERGAEARAQLLQGVQSQGARCFSSPQVSRAFTLVAGLGEGGLLTAADLSAVPDVDLVARQCIELPDWAEVPWAGGDRRAARSQAELLCAVDSGGTFAGVVYECANNGVVFEELGLEAPFAAVPVLRGITRLAPGTSLPGPAGLAVCVVHGTPTCIVGHSSADYVTPAVIADPDIRIQRNTATRLVTVDEQRRTQA
jgi:gamma-glutamyltranspeptidase/glutathione hydrolase